MVVTEKSILITGQLTYNSTMKMKTHHMTVMITTFSVQLWVAPGVFTERSRLLQYTNTAYSSLCFKYLLHISTSQPVNMTECSKHQWRQTGGCGRAGRPVNSDFLVASSTAVTSVSVPTPSSFSLSTHTTHVTCIQFLWCKFHLEILMGPTSNKGRVGKPAIF